MKWRGTPQIAMRSEPAGAVAKRLSRPARILLAEDDWAFRDLLLFAFHECGCDVVAARDAHTLIEALGLSYVPGAGFEPYDLLISDIQMPGWRGFPPLLELIKNPSVPPVVLITAFGSDELHQQARSQGAVAVLDKPFDIGDLTALALAVIEERRGDAPLS